MYIFLIMVLVAIVLVLTNKVYTDKSGTLFSFKSNDITGLDSEAEKPASAKKSTSELQPQ